MNRIILLLLLISLTCAMYCTAFRMHRRGGCICNRPTSHVKPRNIMNWKVYTASPSCKSVEIVVTRKNNKKVCLDPNSELGRVIMRKERGLM